MLIPISTDAPIYHWPFATVGLIVVNTAIMVSVFTMSREQLEVLDQWCVLHYGQWNPVQWLTSNYLHSGPVHLIFNMIALWGLGVIVEGKIGWWRFLAIYNLIGVSTCAVEQTLMLFASEGGSLGASAIIFGLLAIALVWAPANEMTCVMIFGFHFRFQVITFEVTVLNYAAFSLVVQMALAIWSATLAAGADEGGVEVFVSSALLHLMGAAAGAVIGVGMLKLGWVDCEDWDVFSVWAGKHTMSRDQKAAAALETPEAQAKLANLRHVMSTQIQQYLAAGEAAAALAVHRRGRLQFPDWRPDEPQMIQLISGLRKAQLWNDATLMMVEYLQRYTERTPLVRLALAQLLVEQLGRPVQALKVLAKLRPEQLPAPQQEKYHELHARAAAEAEENPFEAVVEDW
jgi:membrane associated rhomboid family serine protease